MRRLVFAALLVALPVALTGRATGDDPKALIEKALKAHGGLENLTKFKAGRMKGKGTLSILGQDLPIQAETIFLAPARYKSVVQFEIMNVAVKQTTVIHG